ncbi:hypothetical protein FQR65_LT19536 [Abscondita terminalis]|nr:hypothetical protein FQR65_LT19536 [Abscondita terminalis]
MYLIFCDHNNDKMQIFVELLTGRHLTLDVTKSNTIQEIKSMILELTGTDVEYQNLVYKKKKMENSKTLAYYEVPNEAVLYLVIFG